MQEHAETRLEQLSQDVLAANKRVEAAEIDRDRWVKVHKACKTLNVYEENICWDDT